MLREGEAVRHSSHVVRHRPGRSLSPKTRPHAGGKTLGFRTESLKEIGHDGLRAAGPVQHLSVVVEMREEKGLEFTPSPIDLG